MTFSAFSPRMSLAARCLLVAAAALTTSRLPARQPRRPPLRGRHDAPRRVKRPDRDRVIARPRAPKPHVPAIGRRRRPPGHGRALHRRLRFGRGCEEAETGPKNDPSDGRCENGFACMWPTAVGAFACQKLCVCRDFVGEPAGGFTKPAACP